MTLLCLYDSILSGMKPYNRTEIVSRDRTEKLPEPEELKYEGWWEELTPSQRIFIHDLSGEGPAYGPQPGWIPLPDDIQ